MLKAAAQSYQELLERNKQWVQERLDMDPEFFAELAKGQQPNFLWIGCSDSRVPANEVTGTNPGEIFVHRNIANVVVHTDMNLLSVLHYAVAVLKVKHVIVCGHYGCGGVIAAMGNDSFGLIDNWLRNIKDVYRLHQEELDSITDTKERERRLVELNVLEQVNNVSKTSIIQEAWKNNDYPTIHGWVYDIADGIINNLGISQKDSSSLDEVYRLKIK